MMLRILVLSLVIVSYVVPAHSSRGFRVLGDSIPEEDTYRVHTFPVSHDAALGKDVERFIQENIKSQFGDRVSIESVDVSIGSKKLAVQISFKNDGVPVPVLVNSNLMALLADESYVSAQKAMVKYAGEEQFDLEDFELKRLPHEIGSLTAVQKMSLIHNKLTALVPEFALLTNMMELQLGMNSFKVFPREVITLKQLTLLTIFANELTELPEEIGELVNLEIFYAGQNQLTRLPASIGKLTKLTSLDLNKNKLTSLPHEIGNLFALYSLQLDCNQLTEVPESLLQLNALRRVNMSGNPVVMDASLVTWLKAVAVKSPKVYGGVKW